MTRPEPTQKPTCHITIVLKDISLAKYEYRDYLELECSKNTRLINKKKNKTMTCHDIGSGRVKNSGYVRVGFKTGRIEFGSNSVNAILSHFFDYCSFYESFKTFFLIVVIFTNFQLKKEKKMLLNQMNKVKML